ncbi:diaminopimelate epimerase [Aestuariimicrobium sp. p3-SID1156]|uniref:diaminopimelate epimerase n=1 Tax=Aestuariimicrobium sp. p3-SID1156 TaxID=2916038 RepID=UPI00223C18E9|nr:diaminopimelate epimerase [Aestuariimicrobium sp. p3-SID1156]MCT1459091.1 diaminopimelate epimerase [Aestuariimicrobium sp. p3-SID1156]
MRSINFTKGHATLNDFVVLVDRHDTTPLSVEDVRLICDRHGGIGADGLLRAVKSEHMPDWDGDPELWFMDYRNADGSIAEMCGNGTRLFARYLVDNDLAEGPDVQIGTRAGLRNLHLHADGSVSTQMGIVRLLDDPVEVTLGRDTWPARKVDVGNPHAVVMLPPGVRVNELDLSQAPTWSPVDAFPEGVNVEFMEVADDHHLAMRVHERGVGETLSCGTGTVATAAAHAAAAGTGDGEYRVDVAGGVLHVTLQGAEATLRGPAMVVARGELQLPDRPSVE